MSQELIELLKSPYLSALEAQRAQPFAPLDLERGQFATLRSLRFDEVDVPTWKEHDAVRHPTPTRTDPLEALSTEGFDILAKLPLDVLLEWCHGLDLPHK